MQFPAIEVEEARAILKERLLVTDDSVERRVPFIGGGVYQFEPFDSGSDVKGKKLIPIPIPGTQMLLHEDWAYITGRIWWRIETQTLQVENLFPEQTELPRPYRDLRFGVSTHMV